MVEGSTAYLQIDFAGTPPFSISYTDGTNVYSQNNITSNPGFIPISPSEDTDYELVTMEDVQCSGNVDGMAFVVVIESTALEGSFIKTYGVEGEDIVAEMVVDSDGNYVVCGQTVNVNGDIDAMITKFNSVGDILDTWRYGNNGNDIFRDFIESADGDYYYAVGYITDATKEGLVMKIDKNGNVVWSRTLATSRTMSYIQSQSFPMVTY